MLYYISPFSILHHVTYTLLFAIIVITIIIIIVLSIFFSFFPLVLNYNIDLF